MNILTQRWTSPVQTRTKAQAQPLFPCFRRVALTRTFVETGDERCPIASIWSLRDHEPTADDSELIRPVVGGFLSWRASLFSLLHHCSTVSL